MFTFFKTLRPSEQLRFGLVAVLIGLAAGSIGFGREIFFLGGILIAGSLIFRKFWIGILAVFLLANAFAQWRFSTEFQHDELRPRVGQEISLTGVVRSFPDVREKTTRAMVRAENFSGKFLLILKNPVAVEYGDRISLCGKLTLPTNFGDFDYREFLKKFHVQTIVQSPESFEILETGGGNFLLRGAKNVRNFLEKNVKISLPPNHATITVGVLLGVKNQLPTWVSADFKNSGLTHLLVVSGTNVAIVLAVVGLLFRRLGRRAAWIGSLVALVFFVAMVGFDPPVLRAALMGGIVGLSAAIGRFSDARNLILLSAVILGLISPRTLHDVSFLLSFAATLGIILGAPFLTRIFSKIFWRPLALVLAVTVAAQIAVLPVLGKSFGTFPIAGFVANLIAEPLVPLLMAFGAVTMLTGFFGGIVAKIFAIPALMIGESLLWVAHIFGKIPAVEVPGFFAEILGWIFLAGAAVLLFSRSFARKFLEFDFSSTLRQDSK
ncbi:ComEC family competence protein [bacterium]|jgi:competence protein ComEC|nr:ComEC family competence protein [bacterium]MBT6831808.1 ComEC family competence protein [bacterium]MBT6996745.1 ComEC family competence protein [bacterium]MBT7772193.1 ComEC family competence protein [bacterium]